MRKVLASVLKEDELRVKEILAQYQQFNKYATRRKREGMIFNRSNEESESGRCSLTKWLERKLLGLSLKLQNGSY